MYSEADGIKSIIDTAKIIVVIQADNPDADSLGSALALEEILGNLNKEVILYCSIDAPGYLRYLNGWDRVQHDIPRVFDASIVVDASTVTLLEKLMHQSNQKNWLAAKPCVVLDHHSVVDHQIPFATLQINDGKRASTGELIYVLCKYYNWDMSKVAQSLLMTSILGDTQGLTNQLATAETYKIMSEMIETGVSRPELEELRRQYSKMPLEIFKYKSELIAHTEFNYDNRIATVTIPQSEINKYSPLYNPAPLIQGDILQVSDVEISIVFKRYDDGKITAAIRANQGAPIAALLAQRFGGGGHDYAGGFKTINSTSFDSLKNDCIAYAVELLENLEKHDSHENIQYTF
jgi:phosphoesterase RecJ-like protein